MQPSHPNSKMPARRSRGQTERLFGLRIEGHLLQLATATRQSDGTFDVEIDEVASASAVDWLRPESGHDFADAFRGLVEKHQMRRGQIAVSLDGDYCVTRVAMGSPDHINQELESLLGRASRYLTLGPGKKVVGVTRNRIHSGVDYFAAAVINQSIIEHIYDALLRQEMNVRWVEPSLVSIARLIDASGVAQDEPLLIADGTGSVWDIGIVHCGRLLLDYRPAAASTIEEIRATTESHIERLRRFCSRHRNVVGGTLSRVLVVGSREKVEAAREAFNSIRGLSAEAVVTPNLPAVYRMAATSEQGDYVPAIAAVLPMMLGTDAASVPDMLYDIRREVTTSWSRRLLFEGWPAIAAAICLMCGYGALLAQRHVVSSAAAGHEIIAAQVVERDHKLASLAKQRQLISYLKSIDTQANEASWPLILDQLTRCLSDNARINQFAFDEQHGLRLDGSVQNEAAIYDFVGYLRQLEIVKQVALQGTSPIDGGDGANFRVLLQIDSSKLAPSTLPIKAKISESAGLPPSGGSAQR